MSWWWKQKPASSSHDGRGDAATTVSIPQTQEEVTNVSAVPLPEPVKRTLTRDEQSELELMEFLKEIQAQADVDQSQGTKSKPSAAPSQQTPGATDISPDSIYPTEISCRSAFDYAMFCQSFGGQFVNVYRYGSFRSCSNHWDDFWLCMKTRNWKKEDRERAIQEHYRKKAVKWKTGPSSEDVWEVRREPVKDPFCGNLAELEAQMAEYKKNNLAGPGLWTPTK
ncbi:uncharacterized protein Z520_10142 [Fonsecaea multimorphosa CBS 102226]|uniref:Early meiotic induction protein 1 n=1 Tax=Fonsecaea multimorphosa CBS 102226 TaxID=1442371 RepID=A0A0D2IAD8_9EURO|nr:uncharacterized protein Z520_10142 [Fonsecaea multimorphosa CBS 102226]KIX94116.1 hypothetical protein Z520_10142 [Fonsecaea multimorphosa CBS 102226]OAL19469.1 hypothetical protein AYO22_09631 [Fonsecaea multimorphosa]